MLGMFGGWHWCRGSFAWEGWCCVTVVCGVEEMVSYAFRMQYMTLELSVQSYNKLIQSGVKRYQAFVVIIRHLYMCTKSRELMTQDRPDMVYKFR